MARETREATGFGPTTELRDNLGRGVREVSGIWWWYLILGVAWIWYGMFVLSYRLGVAFPFGGVGQLVVAGRVETWRWLFIVTGILAVAAGIMTFVWPDITLYVVSILVAWYLWWTQLLPSGGGTAVLEVVGMGHQGACVLSD